jgi:hypothetical protein
VQKAVEAQQRKVDIFHGDQRRKDSSEKGEIERTCD